LKLTAVKNVNVRLGCSGQFGTFIIIIIIIIIIINIIIIIYYKIVDKVLTRMWANIKMPNLMVALSNTGGALCSTPQSLAAAHY